MLFRSEIHILGSEYSSSQTKHYKYNGSSWTSVSTLPYNFYYGSAVVYNNEIHILGGSGSSGNQTKHYKYNGSSWTEVSTLPYYFNYGSAVVHNNEIHILGSYGQTKHYKYNGSSWTSVSTLPYDFYEGSAVVYNNEIHILGGGNGQTKHYKYNGSSWTSVSTLPYYFYLGSAVVYNNEIHILGGDSAGNTNKHNKYKDIISWTNITTSILNKISIPKDMIIQCSSYDTSKTNSSTLQSLGSNKYKALSDTIVYTKEDKVNITNHQ